MGSRNGTICVPPATKLERVIEGGASERRTYRAVVEVEEGRAEELGPLPEDLLGPRPVVGRRRVVEARHPRQGGAILQRGRGDGSGRGGEAGVGPGGRGERRPEEEPPGGGEALHVLLRLSHSARVGGGPVPEPPRRVCASCWSVLAVAEEATGI